MSNHNSSTSNKNGRFNYVLEGDAERFAAIVIASAANNCLPLPTTAPSPALLTAAEIPINPQRLDHLLNGIDTLDQGDTRMNNLSEDDYVPKDTISLDPGVNSNMQPIGTKKPRFSGGPAGFSAPLPMQWDATTYNKNPNPDRIPGLFGYSRDDRNGHGMSSPLTTSPCVDPVATPTLRNISGTPSHRMRHDSKHPAPRRDATSRDFSGQSYRSTSDRHVSSSSDHPHDSSTHHHHRVCSENRIPSSSSAHKRSAAHDPPRPPSPRTAATKSQIAEAAGDTRAALKKAEESFHVLTSLSGMRRSEDEREIDYLKKELEYRRSELERIRGLLHNRDVDIVSMRGRAEKAEARVRTLQRQMERQARGLPMSPEMKIESKQDGGGW